MQGVQVRFLVWEIRPHRLHGMTKNTKRCKEFSEGMEILHLLLGGNQVSVYTLFKFIKFVLNPRVLFYVISQFKRKKLYLPIWQKELYSESPDHPSLYNFTTKRSFFLKPLICPRLPRRGTSQHLQVLRIAVVFGEGRYQYFILQSGNRTSEGSNNSPNVTQLVNHRINIQCQTTCL